MAFSVSTTTARAIQRMCARGMSSTVTKKPVFGFIGLGQMGFLMSSNVYNKAKDQYASIVVADVDPNATTTFVAQHQGVQVAKSAAEVAERADVVVTMLPTPQIVKEVWLGPDGIVKTAKRGALIMDSSTIDPATAQLVAAEVIAQRGADAVDAPVSGGVMGAKKATLTFMVGGTATAFDRARPHLAHMGKNLVHCGSAGLGQVAKLCNNMLLGTTMLAASEALHLAAKLGMDPKLMSSIINTSSGRSWSTDTYNPIPNVLDEVPANKDYAGGFCVSLIQKDMGLAAAAAQSAKAPIHLSTVACETYKHIMTQPGLEKKDFSIVYPWLSGDFAKYLRKK